MKKYEIMAIISNKLTDNEAEQHIKTAITDPIKAMKGTMTFEDFWGSRGFAYQINGDTWGYYFVGQFESDGSLLEELKTDLNIDKNVVRFMITTVEKGTPEPRKYDDMRKEWESLDAKKNVEEAKKSGDDLAVVEAEAGKKKAE